jgi:hypothetical protein
MEILILKTLYLKTEDKFLLLVVKVEEMLPAML